MISFSYQFFFQFFFVFFKKVMMMMITFRSTEQLSSSSFEFYKCFSCHKRGNFQSKKKQKNFYSKRNLFNNTILTLLLLLLFYFCTKLLLWKWNRRSKNTIHCIRIELYTNKNSWEYFYFFFGSCIYANLNFVRVCVCVWVLKPNFTEYSCDKQEKNITSLNVVISFFFFCCFGITAKYFQIPTNK